MSSQFFRKGMVKIFFHDSCSSHCPVVSVWRTHSLSLWNKQYTSHDFHDSVFLLITLSTTAEERSFYSSLIISLAHSRSQKHGITHNTHTVRPQNCSLSSYLCFFLYHINICLSFLCCLSSGRSETWQHSQTSLRLSLLIPDIKLHPGDCKKIIDLDYLKYQIQTVISIKCPTFNVIFNSNGLSNVAAKFLCEIMLKTCSSGKKSLFWNELFHQNKTNEVCKLQTGLSTDWHRCYCPNVTVCENQKCNIELTVPWRDKPATHFGSCRDPCSVCGYKKVSSYAWAWCNLFKAGLNLLYQLILTWNTEWDRAL